MLKSTHSHSQSGTQEIGGRNVPVASLDKASPAQVVAQVTSDHTMESAHPFLQPTVVGIDVLDMINTRNDTLIIDSA